MTYGNLNVDTVTTSTPGGVLGAGNATNFKNRIINGAMQIDQRNAGASVTITSTSSATYTLDRWCAYGSQASKFSVQQNAGSVTPPTGFTNYLGMTSLSSYSVASGEEFSMNQIIEGFNISDLGWGTASAKTITVSFWAYSSLTGTFGGALRNNTPDRSYPFSYSIPTANTWTKISLTIPGDTSGTWLTNNGRGIVINFSLGASGTSAGTAGSWASANYTGATGQTNVVGTNGATLYVTGVQLEVGSAATSFEVRDYGRELILCQRYFTQIGSATYYSIYAQSYNTSGAAGYINLSFPTNMRTPPTTTFTGSWYTINVSSFGVGNSDLNTVSIYYIFSATGNAVLSNGNTGGKLTLSSEL